MGQPIHHSIMAQEVYRGEVLPRPARDLSPNDFYHHAEVHTSDVRKLARAADEEAITLRVQRWSNSGLGGSGWSHWLAPAAAWRAALAD